jgi:serine protease Do
MLQIGITVKSESSVNILPWITPVATQNGRGFRSMLRDVVRIFAQGTVLLARWDKEKNIIHPLGSAFLCKAGGYLLTSAHLFSLNTPLCVVINDGTQEFQPLTIQSANTVPVEVRQYDTINDVALLKFSADISTAVPDSLLGVDNAVELGSTCAYFGFPFSDAGLHVRHVALALVSAKVIASSGTKQYQLDAMVHEGCSGGPLVDRTTGKIIGIISGRFSPTGSKGGVFIGNRPLGTESSISFATCIRHGVDLLEAEIQGV